MNRITRFVVLSIAGGALTASLLAQPALVTSPMPFIGIKPCRIADTRDGTRPPESSLGILSSTASSLARTYSMATWRPVSSRTAPSRARLSNRFQPSQAQCSRVSTSQQIGRPETSCRPRW
jgi:hypothetical protein